ncbi:Lar family restriction alleviation protein [Sphingomonas sp. LB-2]|uniref:Lar family restriction alleviation protein n=1 Tax=Sphingomonas caeni TaxID=2984949 RepID=UPI002231792F|nr:Lar family restriction alleviation protein [Sphingomonas caeni]MCW3847050.1 Lar family restriction alleviation protein [Sphingomonas caeni]
MFFISWGSRGGWAEVGPAGLRHCAYCDKDSYFTRMVAYTVRHIYWIFRWVTGKTPYLVCGNCGAEHADDAADEAHKDVTKAIPAWDRRGWLVGLGGIGALVATGSIAAAADRQSDTVSLAAPHVGDIYEADLARLMTHPDAPVMYSTLRVTKVEGAMVELEFGRTYYNDWRGVDRDVNAGEANSEAYYGPEREKVPVSALQKMFEDGTLHDVRR